MMPGLFGESLSVATVKTWGKWYDKEKNPPPTIHRTLILLFVAANLTSVCQPLDISFNQHFKGVIKRAAASG